MLGDKTCLNFTAALLLLVERKYSGKIPDFCLSIWIKEVGIYIYIYIYIYIWDVPGYLHTHTHTHTRICIYVSICEYI